jgi:homoserine kinase
MNRCRLRVPATSANLGPGFDCLGLALDLYDIIEVEFGGEDVELIDVTGMSTVSPGTDNLLCRAYNAWRSNSFMRRGGALPGAHFRLESVIPTARGLGSSAASIVGGLAAACLVDHGALDEPYRSTIFQLGARLEGHADNVAAATFGGLTVALKDCDGVASAIRVLDELPLAVVLFIPDDPLPTHAARAVLPKTVPFNDAVHNLSHAAYLVAALVTGQFDKVAGALSDALHYPYRRHLMPHVEDLIDAARASSAYGATISGAGPTVIAFSEPSAADAVMAALNKAARECGWPGHCVRTRSTAEGVQIVSTL